MVNVKMQRSLLLVIMVMHVLMASAQEEKKSFWDHGFGKFLKSVDSMIDRWQDSGVDSAYISKLELDRTVYLGYYGYFQQHDMNFPVLVKNEDIPYNPQSMPSNINDMKYVRADMHTYQSEVELGISWRGVSIEVPIPIRNKYSMSFGLAKNGNVWGARIRYKALNRMSGVLEDGFNQAGEQWRANESSLGGETVENHAPVVPVERTIEPGQMDLKIFYVEGYYVFNNKRFSLTAAAYGDMVQKRSAGSLFVMANYYQSSFSASKLFNYDRDFFRNWKVSIGPGYGYNWSMLDGRLCLHASFIPMVSLWNSLRHNGYLSENRYASPEEQKKWENYDTHYYDAVNNGRSRFVFNCFAKVALSYSLDRYLFNILVNYKQYLYRNNSHTRINNREADAQINIGYRF